MGSRERENAGQRTATEVGKEPAVKPGVEPQGKSPAVEPPKSRRQPPVERLPALEMGTKPPATPETGTKPDNGAATEPKKTPPVDGTKGAAQAGRRNRPSADTETRRDRETKPAPSPPGQPEPLGRLLPSEQVLLCDNPPSGWTRVAANQVLIPQQVLALPTYRPKVGLNAGVTVEILGGTRARIVGQQSAGVAGRSRPVRASRADAAGQGRHSAASGVRRSSRHDHLRRCRVDRRAGGASSPRAGHESRERSAPRHGRSVGEPAGRSRGRRRSMERPESRSGWRLRSEWLSTGS